MSLTLLNAVLLMTSLCVAHCSLVHDLIEIQSRSLAAVADLVWLDTEWVLAFHLGTGGRQSAYEAWGRDDDVALSRAFLPLSCFQPYGDNASCCHQHYSSALLSHWPSRQIDQVKVSVMKAGEEVAYIRFNGTGSSALSWFSADRVINSSWIDLMSQPHNYFSIEGHYVPQRNSRRFYVNRNYAGCPGDNGWLSVQDQQYDVCAWGNLNDADPFPVILYSKKNTFARFDSADLGRADALLVTVKFLPLTLDPLFC